MIPLLSTLALSFLVAAGTLPAPRAVEIDTPLLVLEPNDRTPILKRSRSCEHGWAME
jgi:hypothetical protein